MIKLKKYLCVLAIALVSVSSGCGSKAESSVVPQISIHQNTNNTQPQNPTNPNTSGNAVSDEASDRSAQDITHGGRGTKMDIPPDIRQVMAGVSLPEGAVITFEDLSYLIIPHYNFSGTVQNGYMVVNKKLADEVLDIFAELYRLKYPIERMEIIDYYNGSDFESIEANNTSSFNYRVSTANSGKLSAHAYGCAIDINPQINPYVGQDGTGSHQNAKEYWSRNTDLWTSETAKKAFIGENTAIYDVFVNKHGWTWGGSWSSYRDYQHFEKRVY